VAGDERIRLFCGLQLPAGAVEVVATWQAEHLDGVRGRIVPPEHLHVTLAFLGSRPGDEVPAIAAALGEAAARAAPAELRPLRYRETRSVGMIVCEDRGGTATALAADLGERLERLGVYRREGRPWLPHLTVLRFREPPRLRPPLPELGNVRSVRCALYRSILGAGGARYEVLESLSLGGR